MSRWASVRTGSPRRTDPPTVPDGPGTRCSRAVRIPGPSGPLWPRACPLNPGPDQHRREDRSGAVDDRELVEPRGQAPPLLEQGEGSLDDVAVLVGRSVELSNFGGRPPAEPRRRRCSCWSRRSGMTAVIPRAFNVLRIAWEEYALSPSSMDGVVRGRPAPVLGMCRSPSSNGRDCPSCACPGVTTTARRRPRPSTAWWTFVVNPPRERPIACPTGSQWAPGPRAWAAARHDSGRWVFVACWWARLIVESTATRRSTCPAASASASSTPRIRSQVSSSAHRRWRAHTVFHDPNLLGRSHQGMPVRYR